MVVYVMGQQEAIDRAEEVNPSYLLSFQDPGPHPKIPVGPDLRKHLRLKFHDIFDDRVEYPRDRVIPAIEHIEGIIEFGRSWNRQGPLLIHCQAGVSRSTAAALTILSTVDPGNEQEYAQEMRANGPWIQPNTLMIRLADNLLGHSGALIRAVSALPAPTKRGGPHAIKIRLKQPSILDPFVS